jgi:hypothetical protein
MNISNTLRKLAGLLSFYYTNNEISAAKDKILRKKIVNFINNKTLNIRSLKKTHQIFNNEIILLLKKSNIKNFLRENFIQKMFFLHNRLFVFSELKKLKKDKKWKFYKNLIVEDDVGNPIRYFLYPKSSGNKINHVYHLKILSDMFKINLKRDVKKIFEFGAGYGCMARIFSKINTNIDYTCFDTYYVNLLQYYYLKHNNLNVGFSKTNKILLTSSLKRIKNKNDLFIANWSLSETPINFRKNFIPLISKSKFVLICFQEKFENIDNLKFFKKLRLSLSNKFDIKIVHNEFYKGNLLSNQNHYFFVGKKI